MENIDSILKAVQEESKANGLGGWIFTNFSHRDSLTDNLLSLDSGVVSTRRWVYIVNGDGSCTKIVHAIEKHNLDSLPGEAVSVYSSKETLLEAISAKTDKTKKYALLCDEDIPVISTVDGGFVSLLTGLGISICSAGPLIQRGKGILSEERILSHERSASLLYLTVYETWSYISDSYRKNRTLTERDVCDFILSEFQRFNLITDHPPIVAFGKNSGNPHYEVPERGSATAEKGDVIQLDIWAKDKDEPDSIYADISWVGVYDTSPTPEVEKLFATVCKARDLVKATIEKDSIGNITGAMLDSKVREIIINAGYGDAIKHRTGHGIDTNCHGSGVNLDSTEFPDKRKLLEYSCFSVEPGIYFDKYGFRTEIDIYIKDGKPVISGSMFKKCPIVVPQTKLLTIS
ncbi:MAG: M24 family metallopeptidase [Treponemataceae bacterium]|nr:M24 family metallopeptidase [Treponemataceae bacterium]